MAYQKTITRAQPGLIICLVDRSYSMSRPAGGVMGGVSLAEMVADIVNDFIAGLAMSCMPSPEGVRPYYFVGLIGYGETEDQSGAGVESLFRGDLRGEFVHDIQDISSKYLRIEERPPNPSSSIPGGPAEVWVEPAAGYGTPMCEALHSAGQLVQRFCESFPESFPPVVFNFTDGEPTDEDSFAPTGQAPATLEEWAQRLCSLKTEDGNALLLNAYLSAEPAVAARFPATPEALPGPGRRMFGISSGMPDILQGRAMAAYDQPLPAGSRGLVVNASASDLMKLLKIGTVLIPDYALDA